MSNTPSDPPGTSSTRALVYKFFDVESHDLPALNEVNGNGYPIRHDQ